MKKPKPPRLVTVFIFSTITIIFWIFFSLYNLFTNDDPLTVDPKILEPITPNFDTQSLNNLQPRVFFEEQEVNTSISVSPESIPIISQPTPTEVPTEIPEESVIEPTIAQ